MVIFGFMLNYALRVNLTIAIVEMVSTGTTAAVSTTNGNEGNATTDTTLAELVSTNPTPSDDVVRFDWSEKDVQLILGSFFWGYIMTELPGGRLAELVGGHRVFGHSMLWSSVVTLVIPLAANRRLMACNSSHDSCLDSPNGALKVLVRYDGFSSRCRNHHAYLWFHHIIL
jgi:MFS transporter, ACS family, solute carrier family 17 (sodium-dependent inorganic phosphate cotransporter), other